ncbi:hypothetical protein [Bordetella avium]|uniref:hypothetical protein n=1 Tax=Bordetella avium TaxID=521 RepID=UPI000E69D165|nr:hypothetical protein [Bordetella avium]RIQ51030.1 hypothetical protein D0843_11095 [Bordetella avium]
MTTPDAGGGLIVASHASVLDLAGRSTEFPIVIAFPKSTSIGYPTALATAKAATQYMEVVDKGKVTLHLAAFAASKQQFMLAQALARLLMGLRGVQIYVKGIYQKGHDFNFINVLECFITSLSVDDWRAHCQVVVDKPFTSRNKYEVRSFLIPCFYMFRHASTGYALSLSHPSPLETQVAASGARVGCDWCPNFRPQDTRPVDQADSKRERLYAQEVEIQDKQGNVKS